MATIKRDLRSGEGDRIGVGGVSATELYQVTLDDVDDVPAKTFLTSYPLGTPHPKSDYAGLFLVDAYHEETIDYFARLHTVRAVYGLPIVALLPEWEISYHGVTELSEIQEDLDGKPIGARSFRVKDPDDSASAVTHIADYDGDDDLNLVYTEGTTINGLPPVTAYKPVIGITARRVIPNFTTQTLGRITDFFCTVNADAGFLGFDVGQVLFLNMELTPTTGSMFGQLTPNKVYDVTLEFIARPEPWSTYRVYDFWVDKTDKGLHRVFWKTPIDGVFQRSYRDFRIVGTSVMNDLFRLLAGFPSRLIGVVPHP